MPNGSIDLRYGVWLTDQRLWLRDVNGVVITSDSKAAMVAQVWNWKRSERDESAEVFVIGVDGSPQEVLG